MSDTERKRFDGSTIRDGEWGRHCPEAGCPVCVQGREQKRAHNKKVRREGKRESNDHD